MMGSYEYMKRMASDRETVGGLSAEDLPYNRDEHDEINRISIKMVK